ncbi:VWA domain-containing protein [Parafrankia sp. EUN1f]|uniref:vWA domain-containing protein n=1 Tax=Parafrankia sp. EUN1f TaxID=102897 RepID=UPI0001C44AC4|nr:VWA domain-containing protein [Parafrankia sp. EUN1f]EFC83774.1 von Willebrand factor type A [Parafrankia sp. EUN1f]
MTSPAGGARCLPTYAVLDTSKSMSRFQQLLNDTLENVYDGLWAKPAVSEFAHLSIISFNTDAHVILPMSDIGKIDSLPMLACGGSTNYGKAFRLIATQIDKDVTALRAQGRKVLRPAVFFITDGAPQDAGVWESEFAKLTAPDWPRHPHVITFGFGDANEAVLRRISTKSAFKAEPGVSQQDALVKVLVTLLNTLINSANSQNLALPTDIEGFRPIPIEFVD